MGNKWFNAAKRGDIKILEKCINKRCKRKSSTFTIDDYDEFNNTAVHLTIMNKHMYALKFLLEHNARIDMVDAHKNTALHLSVWTDQLEFVELLLSFCSKNINSVNEYGETPLHMAAKLGNYSILELLLNVGGKPNIQNHEKHTVLCIACQYGKEDIIHMLLQSDPNHIRDHPNPGSPLYLAASFGKLNVLKILIGNGIDVSSRVFITGKTALHGAVSNCRVEIVRYLLKENIDATVVDYESKTALDICRNVLHASEADTEIYNCLNEYMKKKKNLQEESSMNCNDESIQSENSNPPKKPLILPKPKTKSTPAFPVSKSFNRLESLDEGDDDVFSQDLIHGSDEEKESPSPDDEDLIFHANRINDYKNQLNAIMEDDSDIEDIESVLMKMKNSMTTS